MQNDRIGGKSRSTRRRTIMRSSSCRISIHENAHDQRLQDKIRYGADKDQGRAKFSLAMLLARNTLAADA